MCLRARINYKTMKASLLALHHGFVQNSGPHDPARAGAMDTDTWIASFPL